MFKDKQVRTFPVVKTTLILQGSNTPCGVCRQLIGSVAVLISLQNQIRLMGVRRSGLCVCNCVFDINFNHRETICTCTNPVSTSIFSHERVQTLP